MYKLLLLVVVLLTGCYPAGFSQYSHISDAFKYACTYDSIESSLVNDGNKLILTATCTKDK